MFGWVWYYTSLEKSVWYYMYDTICDWQIFGKSGSMIQYVWYNIYYLSVPHQKGTFLVLALFDMAQKQNNEKGILLMLLIPLCHNRRETKNFKAVLLKMAFACMDYIWKFPHELWKLWIFKSNHWLNNSPKQYKQVKLCSNNHQPCIKQKLVKN